MPVFHGVRDASHAGDKDTRDSIALSVERAAELRRGGAAAHAVGPAAVLVGRDYSTAGVLADDSPDTVTFSWFGCVGHMGKSSMRAISWEGWRGRSRVGSLVE